jgi:hypothetical protein
MVPYFPSQNFVLQNTKLEILNNYENKIISVIDAEVTKHIDINPKLYLMFLT